MAQFLKEDLKKIGITASTNRNNARSRFTHFCSNNSDNLNTRAMSAKKSRQFRRNLTKLI